MSRVYDIELSCGCLFSSFGDWSIPCFSDDCKAQEEYYDKFKNKSEDLKDS